jgi:mono/diheme cytochrome c family protein
MSALFRIAATVLMLTAATLLGAACTRRADDSPPALGPAVEAVAGPSWLKHLGLDLGQTRMGKMGGEGGPPQTPRVEELPEISSGTLGNAPRRFSGLFRSDAERARSALNEPFRITGADLYRLDCRSCHGPDGAGAPPEINSLLGPAQATSPSLVRQHMRARGVAIDEAMVRQLTAEAEQSLRKTIAEGGKKMPPFGDLQGQEVDALVEYLKKLAGAPPTECREVPVTESAARVGEHLIAGTCHICHDATGPGSGRMMMMGGVIPSLASFPEQKSLGEVVGKVRFGRSSMMGMMGTMGGDRMPVFAYLTNEEVAASYLYLARDPPQP